ncbi:MAG: capsule assembly Wzi family protein [Pseudomonadales bacterium]|nr:capsule assembly Wzi family protein [Pseudomonadales bacterium]
MPELRNIFIAFACLMGGVIAANGNAAPWTPTEDLRLRVELQRVTDAGLIQIPLTSWPIPWADIEYALNHQSDDMIQPELEKSLQSSLNYIRKELAKNYKIGGESALRNTTYEASVANTSSLFNSFGHAVEQEAIVALGTEWNGEILSAGIEIQYASNPIDERNWRFDGSYVAARLGNWNLAVGATERWWGPGWQSSLILSNNPRPVPAISFSRAVSHAPKSKWLHWIGPWHLISFIGQLEQDRFIPEAKLFGMRFSFKPFPNFEFGFSRTAQFGGVGRSQTLGDLGRVFIGKDENQAGGPGNQLGGFDARFSWMVFETSGALYGQLIGEDEAGFLPSKYIFLAGLELSGVPINRSYLSLFFEYSDTLSGRIVNDERPNTAYGHSVYRSGYHYRSRPIGSSFDNDSRSITLGAMLVNNEGGLWKVAISQLDLNTDGITASNQISKKHHKLQHFVLNHQRTINFTTLNLGIEWSSSIPDTNLADTDRFGVYASLGYRI